MNMHIKCDVTDSQVKMQKKFSSTSVKSPSFKKLCFLKSAAAVAILNQIASKVVDYFLSNLIKIQPVVEEKFC